jgi:hypothetical protein
MSQVIDFPNATGQAGPDLARALDRMDLLITCWQAVSDLLIPGADLSCIDRGRLAVLTGFLAEEYAKARENLSEALRR